MAISSIGSLDYLPMQSVDPDVDLILLNDSVGNARKATAGTIISRDYLNRSENYRCETLKFNIDSRTTKDNIYKHINIDNIFSENSMVDCSIEFIVNLSDSRLQYSESEYKRKRRLLPAVNIISYPGSQNVYICTYERLQTFGLVDSTKLNLTQIKSQNQSYALSSLLTIEEGSIKFENISYRSGVHFDTTINFNIYART